MTTNNHKYNLSPNAKFCISKLEAAGFEAWAVGGCVRDLIMGKVPHDYDVTTNALPAQIKEVFAEQTTIDTGIKHGTVSVLLPNAAFRDDFVAVPEEAEGCLEGRDKIPQGPHSTIEITTYRTDGKYTDGRHPDGVEFVTSIDEDLKRRDFTMNAICYNPTRGIYDPLGGQADIEAKIIRAVGDPKQRFKEDALRILRAVRFASQTGFEIEEETYHQAYLAKAQLLIAHVSSERITVEIDKLLQGEYVLDTLEKYADIIEVAIPEITATRGFEQRTKYHAYTVWGHTAHVVAAVKNTQLLRWAALCHDLGKPSTFFLGDNGQGHFYGHAIQGKQIAEAMLRRFSLKGEVKNNIVTLVERHNDTLSPTVKSIRETINKMNGNVWLFRQLLALKRADSLGHAPGYTEQVHVYDEIEKLLDELLRQGFPFTVKDLPINGKDLLELGIPEGPEIKEKLEAALQLVQIQQLANEREAILARIKRL